MVCVQCGQSAIFHDPKTGLSLCIDHYLRLQQALQLQYSRNAAIVNFLTSQIESATGIYGVAPRFELPQAAFSGETVLNNIRFDHNTIGVVNTGTIQSLDLTMTAMRNQGHEGLVEAIQRLTQAVLDDAESSKELKEDILEQLDFLSREALKPESERSKSVVKAVFGGLERTITLAASLIGIWAQCGPVIRQAMGL